jgi:hypothetical protein
MPNGYGVGRYTKIFHPEAYQNWHFWSENIPSGNPDRETRLLDRSRDMSRDRCYDFLIFFAKKIGEK